MKDERVITPTQYARPASVEEAVRLMADGGAVPFAGSTDLLPQMRSGKTSFAPLLLNLNRIPELRGIGEEGAGCRIGALATVTEVLESALLRERAPVLPLAADCFASGQVRNSATLGGNVCNASPAGDLIIPLILLDAEVELASFDGGRIKHRRMPIADFFAGPGKTKRAQGELLEAFHFAWPLDGVETAFKKFGMRPALDIAVVSVGVAAQRKGGAFENVRVAFGAVAPTPIRGRGTEAALEGRSWRDETIARAVRAADEEIAPISDVRASAWYRKELVRIFLERLLRDVSKSGD